MATFGEQIRKQRKHRCMKAKDLAAAAGISPQYLNDIERDRRNPPSDDVIDRLARSLNMTPDFAILWAGRLPLDLRELSDAETVNLMNHIEGFRIMLRRRDDR